MPALMGGGEFSYKELLKIRQSAAAADFRRIVSVRDSNPPQDLLQAFYRGIKDSFGARVTTRISRFLFTTALGSLNPVLGAMLSSVDTFLLDKLLGRRDARYFVDEQLKRLTPRH